MRRLYQWVKRESKSWAGLTRHSQDAIGVFSRGAARAGSSQLWKIAGASGGQAASQRRRLQRFVKKEQPLGEFFGGWSRSVVKRLKQKRLVLVVDETKLRDELGVMMVGLAYQGRCIPLAWRVYRANSAADYPAEGQVAMILALLAAVKSRLSAATRVLVLADRGIGTSPDLMRGVMALGWSFLFRVTRQSKIILPDGTDVTFYDQIDMPGQAYAASGLVFKKRGLVPAHVRVLWGLQAKGRWSLVTNDPTLSGWEYALRMSIDESFRDLKSFGFQLEDADLSCPSRVAHLLIFIAVAYSFLLWLGQSLEAAHATARPRKRANGSFSRRWSLFREGRQAFLASPF